MKKRLVFFLLGALMGAKVMAQETADSAALCRDGHWMVMAAANMSYFLPSKDNKSILHSHGVSYYDVRAMWQADTTNTNPYDRSLNRPILQAGVMMADLTHLRIYRDETPYHSTIGRMWTFYGGFQIDLLRSGRWSMGLDLQNGVGVCTDPYDEDTNADNVVIGNRLSFFVNLGIYARYRLSPRWSASLNADFKHYSNGSLDRPNLGINTIGPTVALSYDLEPQPLRAPEGSGGEYDGEFKRSFYVETVAGLGLKALIDGFNVYHSSHNPVYGFFTVMAAPMYRYHRLHATGIGFDYSYCDYVYRIKELDQILERSYDGGYSPHVLGATLRHEMFYRNLSVNVGLGVYFLKKMGYTSTINESRTYQHVGLRYSMPFTKRRLFVGYNIKAHRFSKVDGVQLMLGYRI